MFLEHPLRPFCDQWLAKLRIAYERKMERFGNDAAKAHKFYNHSCNWMWMENMSLQEGGFLSEQAFGSSGRPGFLIQINKVFEAVALYGPALYHQNPQVSVRAMRRPQLPPHLLGIDVGTSWGQQIAMQLQQSQEIEYATKSAIGELKQFYLDWLQVEAGKKIQAHSAINEAVIKGMGTLWTEMYQPSGSMIHYPKSTYRSVDGLLIDPDASHVEDIQWIALRHIQPVNRVEERFGLPYGTLKGQLQSLGSQSSQMAGGIPGMPQSTVMSTAQASSSFDLIEYCDIWSKNGFGDRLKSSNRVSTKTEFDVSVFGDFTYIVVANGIPYPLNMPSSVIGKEDPRHTYLRAQWPIPYWIDSGGDDGWPVEKLGFYEDPNSVWPISIVKPAMGEIQFVNWCMSFLADKVAASCTTYLGMLQDAAEDIRRQLEDPGAPYRVLEISRISGMKMSDVVSFLQAPDFPQHIWAMVSQVLEIIDKKTGITDLLHGLTGRQIRSATEADVRQQNLNIRPDDMASRVEDFLSGTATKEMIAACWMLEYEDLEPVLGPHGAMVLSQYVKSQDFDRVVRDYDYRVVADSARKPNREQKLADLYELGRTVLPVAQQLVVGGVTGPWNAYITDVCQLLNLDPRKYVVQLPPPQQQGPSEDERKAMAKEQQRQIDLRYELLRNDLDLRQMRENHEEDLRFREAMNDESLAFARESHRVQSAGKRNG